MASEHLVLLIIIVAGGIGVLGSYVLGLVKQPGESNPLWGGVPAKYRSAYTVSMLMAATGYFALVYYIMFHLDPSETSIAGIFGFSIFYVIFLFILVPSAFWMPLTSLHVKNPGKGAWGWIRTVLAMVGIASTALTWALVNLEVQDPGTYYWLAVAGSVYFAFHTAILDAIIWAALFKIK